LLKTLQSLVEVGEQMLAASDLGHWEELAALDRQRRGLLKQLSSFAQESVTDQQEINRLAERLRLQDQQLQRAVSGAHCAVLKALRGIRSGRSARKAYSSEPSPT